MAKESSRGTWSKGNGTAKSVSSARLHQKSGASNSYGGYTKVNQGNGNFTMKPTGSRNTGSGK